MTDINELVEKVDVRNKAVVFKSVKFDTVRFVPLGYSDIL